MASRWRAQLLPQGSEWDHLIQPMMRASGDLATEIIPFLLSDVHTSDPALIIGCVSGFQLDDDGFNVLLRVDDDERAQILRDDSDLRAAPQIVLDWVAPDGRTFPAIVRHVIATHDPLITGLRGFEEVRSVPDPPDLAG